MNTRREARQLQPGDHFQVTVTLQLEVVGKDSHMDGRVTLYSNVVPCSYECGDDCGCDSHIFQDSPGPYRFELKESQRVPFLGNLQQLLADSQRLKSQIARLTRAATEGESGNESGNSKTFGRNKE